MSEPTQIPWVARYSEYLGFKTWKVYLEGRGELIATVGVTKTEEETAANAHKIAASPDLLKVCEVLIAQRVTLDKDTRAMLHAAVAKARGKDKTHAKV